MKIVKIIGKVGCGKTVALENLAGNFGANVTLAHMILILMKRGQALPNNIFVDEVSEKQVEMLECYSRQYPDLHLYCAMEA